MEYVLTAKGLCKQYRNFKALNGLDMHVPKGAIYGFVGKNGAGKTTLIRLICGLQKPDAGEYVLYGNSSRDKRMAKSRRRMGAVVETPSVYLDMTAEDNLKEQCRILGVPSFGEVGELLKLVGLSDAGKKKAKNFSLGMRQRLGIAVALVGNPDFLVLDEPVNGLDPQGIIEIREMILKLNRERQITVLISSHMLDELSRLATHYGFIDHGQMIKEISAKELEQSCRKCLRIEAAPAQQMENGSFEGISFEAALMRGLHGMEYRMVSERVIDVFGEVPVTKLVLSFAQEGLEIVSVHAHDETLESYYVNLLGGEKHE